MGNRCDVARFSVFARRFEASSTELHREDDDAQSVPTAHAVLVAQDAHHGQKLAEAEANVTKRETTVTMKAWRAFSNLLDWPLLDDNPQLVSR